MSDTFPRQYARTQRLTLGEPRNVVVSPDGRRVTFLRSRGGSDPVNCLWLLDVATGEERLVADPVALALGADGDVPPEERARRERMREGAGGIVAYATNAAVTVAAFALSGKLYAAGLMTASARPLDVPGPVYDPRPDPTARRIAYVREGALWIAELDGTAWELAAEPGDDDVTWGLAEFIAAEEMHRFRGYWWAPDGEAIAVCRVDNGPVDRWHIGDPAQPATAPREIAYPAAGTPNADVTLHVMALDGGAVEVRWDRAAFPYLADVTWADRSSLLVTVQSRDQRDLRVLAVDAHSGETVTACEEHDDAWVDLVPGVANALGDGRVVSCGVRDGSHRLLVDGRAVTDAGLEVRSVTSVDGGRIVFVANPQDDATVQHVYRWTEADGVVALTSEPGVHSAAVGGETFVIRSAALGRDRSVTGLLDGPEIQSFAEAPLVTPNVSLLRVGSRRIATAVLLPAGRAPGDGGPVLPVLMDPYAGPHALRVVQSNAAFCSSQWFADQGFAVVVADGAGTPGRGAAWEREVHLDLAGPVLADQVDALEGAAAETGVLDLGHVGIRGWSFGGYLAALAVLRRPDVFHAAVAGAPVTEWRLYDTHYTERYLGDPNADPEPYDRGSLLLAADELKRPLMIVHGLADDNVVAAHSLQFSSALLAAGRPHELLPLAGVTHMTPQEVVAENLLLLQLEFLRRSLGL